jgi:hypothetical protein
MFALREACGDGLPSHPVDVEGVTLFLLGPLSPPYADTQCPWGLKMVGDNFQPASDPMLVHDWSFSSVIKVMRGHGLTEKVE